jgi:hypothetical protein
LLAAAHFNLHTAKAMWFITFELNLFNPCRRFIQQANNCDLMIDHRARRCRK